MQRFSLFVVLLTISVSGCVRSLTIDPSNPEVNLRKGETLLLPVNEQSWGATMTLYDMDGNMVGAPLAINGALDSVQYTVPFTVPADVRVVFEGIPEEAVFFDKLAAGPYRRFLANPSPKLHFRPGTGWMNDPNGLLYKDGLYHLYYQQNPVSAQGGNTSWGHAVSRDLYRWRQCDTPILPDSLGLCWSGSCVVDEDNVSGLGKGAVLAFYTSTSNDGIYNQRIAIAYSLDGGYSFEKYPGNPVVGPLSDTQCRDAKVLFHEESGKWVMILTRSAALEFFTSENLINWTFANRLDQPEEIWGGAWECPDLFKLPYGDGEKWVLLASHSNWKDLGFVTTYQIGEFDGTVFTPEKYSTLADYGFEYYAAIIFQDAPKPVMVGWDANWRYTGYDDPGNGYRGEMAVPRDVFLMDYGGEVVLGSYPVASVLKKGRRHIFEYKAEEGTVLTFGSSEYRFTSDRLTVRRAASARAPEETSSAPLEPRASHDVLVLRFEDSTEMFIDGGAVALTVRDW
ncbi:MAG: glycoside hydrolase family 32 protein [Bacteroidales bacterium]|nr:glycoside hydrolase family 32 protein [Bacteroidales bacterium]